MSNMKRKYSLDFKLLKMENQGSHPVSKILINGVDALFVVDTGASHTVLDSNRLNRFSEQPKLEQQEALSTGLGTNQMQSSVTRLKTLQLGKLTLNRRKVAVLDLSHINQTYRTLGLKEIDGVLGCDLLKKLNADIRFSSRKIFFYF